MWSINDNNLHTWLAGNPKRMHCAQNEKPVVWLGNEMILSLSSGCVYVFIEKIASVALFFCFIVFVSRWSSWDFIFLGVAGSKKGFFSSYSRNFHMHIQPLWSQQFLSLTLRNFWNFLYFSVEVFFAFFSLSK